MKQLEELHLCSVDAPAIAELASSSIRCLRLVGGTHAALDAVAELNVTELHLDSGMGTKGRLDLRPLAKMKSLERLGVAFRGDRMEGLDALELERIWTWSSGGVAEGAR